MESNEYLMISGIQHFLFCKRQWALIHIENQWNENSLTAEGRVMHNRVHDGTVRDNRNGVITIRGLQVKSDKYRITGTCDAVEFLPDESGVNISKMNGLRRIRPVEYKRGHSKISDCDRIQVTTQAICLEGMLACDIKEGAVFYGETRRRETFAITNELRDTAISALEEMWGYYSRGHTPKVKPSAKCKKCSLINICCPGILYKRTQDVGAYTKQHISEEL